MVINWSAVATIAAPIIALFVGVWINRRFENRPVLISYFGHVAAFRTTPPSGQPIFVHTHAVVLRNVGRRSATNIRLRHNVLPDFIIWPELQHHIEDLPGGGGREIVIPTLVPGEEITVSYLYFPPVTVAQVNTGIRSNEGFARQIPVLLQRVYPKWFNLMVTALMLIGLVSLVYIAFYFVLRLVL
jgi:hypothetical protein